MNTMTRAVALGPLSPRPSDLPAPPPPEQGGDWTSGLRILRRRIWLILGLTSLLCLAALPSILASESRFEGGTRVLIAPSSAVMLAASMDGRPSDFDIDAEVQRLRSRAVAAELAARFDLFRRPEFNADLRVPGRLDAFLARVRAYLDPGGAQTVAEADLSSVETAFLDALSVSRQGNGSVVAIGFTSRDAELVRDVPGAVVETYLRQRKALWAAEVETADRWLSERIATESARVQDGRAALDDLRDAAGLDAAESEESATRRRLLADERLAEIGRDRSELARDLRAVARAIESPGLSAPGEPEAVSALRAELRAETLWLDEFTQTYGDGHETVQRRRDLAASIRDAITAELRAHAGQLRARDEALAEEAATLEAELRVMDAQLAVMRQTAPVLKERAETLRAQESTLATLEYRRQVLRSQAGLAPVTLEVLVPARKPTSPQGPGRKLYLMITGAFALLVSAVVAAIVEARDGSVRSHEQIAGLRPLGALALWPRLPVRQRRRALRDIATNASAPVTAQLDDMLTLLAEDCGGTLPGVLTVTVPRDRDRTLPVADWIATALAARGRKVTLLDASGAPSGGTAGFGEGRIRRIALPSIARHQGDLAGALAGLAHDAGAEDRTLIIDAPPLLAPGALAFAQAGDELLLVLRWGVTPKGVVELAAALLSKLGRARAHVLIADANPRRHRLYGFTDRLTLAPSLGGSGPIGFPRGGTSAPHLRSGSRING